MKVIAFYIRIVFSVYFTMMSTNGAAFCNTKVHVTVQMSRKRNMGSHALFVCSLTCTYFAFSVLLRLKVAERADVKVVRLVSTQLPDSELIDGGISQSATFHTMSDAIINHEL